MAFTYEAASIATDPLMEIRFLLGDTDADIPLFQDEEITALLTANNSDVYAVSILCCKNLLAHAAQQVTHWVGPEKEVASDLYEHYKELLAILQRENERDNSPGPTLAVGHAPVFGVNMMNDPGDHDLIWGDPNWTE